MIVVPGLPPGEDRQPGQVPRFVLGVVVTTAEVVTERIDAEGRVSLAPTPASDPTQRARASPLQRVSLPKSASSTPITIHCAAPKRAKNAGILRSRRGDSNPGPLHYEACRGVGMPGPNVEICRH